MTLHATLEAGSGFANPVQSSQSAFRCVMNALARPGSVQTITETVNAPSLLVPAATAVALALFDHDTPIWVDHHLAEESGIGNWLRFQTGAPIAREASGAAFALIHGGVALPDFGSFALGTPEYPDRSATLVVQVDTLSEGPELVLSGPGIRGASSLHAGVLPPDFVARMQANHALFPRGVDLLLVCGNQLAALPRSTRVAAKEA